MSTEKMREEFEEWMRESAKIIVGSSDPYPAGLERAYWKVWQASRAAIEVEIPIVCASDDPFELKRDIVDEIESLGLRVKS